VIRLLLIGALLAVGLWQLAAAAGIQAKAWLGQHLLERAWHQQIEQGEPVKPWPGARSHPVARLRVPELEVDHLVLDSAATPVLAWGPGMEVGPHGHRLIAAHRDTHFRFLEQVRAGQTVMLDLPDGVTEHWRVGQRAVVDAREHRLDLAIDDRTMTWVTCWPFDAGQAGGPLRLLVELSRQHPSPLQAISEAGKTNRKEAL